MKVPPWEVGSQWRCLCDRRLIMPGRQATMADNANQGIIDQGDDLGHRASPFVDGPERRGEFGGYEAASGGRPKHCRLMLVAVNDDYCMSNDHRAASNC